MKAFNFIFSICLCLYCHTLFGGILSSHEELSIQQKYTEMTKERGKVMFTPPESWQLADTKTLPASIKLMVVGKGSKPFPPSMNLSTEPYTGTLKQYLKRVKSINESQGDAWKDLGNIKTEAGNASLSQVDLKSEWGTVRMMHVIFLHEGTAHILTASALQEEFHEFYDQFFNALKSLRINK